MYFGNSDTKIYTTQEDYKPDIICEHCCQIPIPYNSLQHTALDRTYNTITLKVLQCLNVSSWICGHGMSVKGRHFLQLYIHSAHGDIRNHATFIVHDISNNATYA